MNSLSLSLLRRSGWFETYRYDAASLIVALENKGFTCNPYARQFWERYGGLRCHFQASDGVSSHFCTDWSVTDLPEFWHYDWIQGHVGETIFPCGDASYPPQELFVTESGKGVVYVVDYINRYPNPDQAIDFVLSGNLNGPFGVDFADV